MIQFRRGKTSSWLGNTTKLADGQPGYDRTKNKLKIGDGESDWTDLKYLAGLSNEEILSSEEDAKGRFDDAFNIIKLAFPLLDATGLAKKATSDSPAVITYGTESPDESTVGRLYLQQYPSSPEADYVISYGVNNGWTYQKWKSGVAECWRTVELTSSLNTSLTTEANSAVEASTSNATSVTPTIYYNDTPFDSIQYPITFKDTPIEIATVQSSATGIWLATMSRNTTTTTAKYRLAFPAPVSESTFYISINVKGRCN